MTPQLAQGTATLATSVTNGATFTSTAIDTLVAGTKAGWATIDVFATTQAASTQAGSPNVLKIQESDSTSATTFVDIVGLRGGSAAATNVDFVVGIGKTAGINSYKFNIYLPGRKRYLSVVASPTTTQSFSVAVNLGHMGEAPTTAVRAGALNLVSV